MTKLMLYQQQKFARRWGLNESIARSTVKTISYRFGGSAITFMVAFVFTGEVAVSASISVVEFLLKPGMYWCHERVWNKIGWGKN
jgi:uncharacterized membrane protein